MDSRLNLLSFDKIFVGIFKKEDSYEVRILPSSKTFKTKNPDERYPLVYYRSFSEAILALGYRNILRRISSSSIKNLVRKANPEEKNLLY